MGKKNSTRVPLNGLKKRRRQLIVFCLEHHLVHATASFLANAHSAHNGGKVLVSRSRWRVQKSLGLYQRKPWIGNLHTVCKYFYHRTAACNQEILVN